MSPSDPLSGADVLRPARSRVRRPTSATAIASVPQEPSPASPDVPLSVVLENTIVGIGALYERRFLWANARMAEIFGYTPSELVGESVRRFYVTQEDYEAVGEAYERLSRGAYYTHEHAQVRKNGEIIWCRISGRTLDPSDPESLSIWVVQDLTDKKRAEDQLRRVNQQLEQTIARRTTNLHRSNAALRNEVELRRKAQTASAQSRDKYRALFRNLPMGVIVTNHRAQVLEINRKAQLLLGASTRNALDPVLADPTRVLGPDGGNVSLGSIIEQQQRCNPRGVHRFDFRWVAGDASLRYISATVVPLSTGDLGALLTLSDVTEQRLSRERENRQREELTRASRVALMGQLASSLAHELGQPLNVCQSYLMGIRHRLTELVAADSSIRTALDKAMDQLVLAGDIIANVRSFVSKEAPEFRETSVHELVSHTLQLLEFPLRDAGITVSVTESDSQDVLRARCHPVEIQQVLVNLLINAIDALQSLTGVTRMVEISIEPASRAMLLVRVSDNGPGIPPQIVESLFDTYVTTKSGGLGMGLMICRTIIESHGGRLAVSRSRAGGACFSFTLQRVAQ